ncbi:MAG: heme lyase CcmF/NrfE family subunit [Deltaproteobacteria bacterium]|jgi:cytochrome c-type biogenesis protein CcmF|nr:heme lyase CcmF/NrfE family subunit [Deltaproteobacteria bacterium]MBT4263590.1 heme lyase CcmF/NrfE family subunit [Deltaproteobacteria bacterium]MBT6616352.1 heme lyase CcmF/NrfE family subunit [Deltaproteobacteria bacterium]MBT7152548.1 heme lyase CcmF/NrfE family subunit [Deltaproteobacteria bacterium]MBT7715986.1 heme lyase CcmF/NrfE family subunit [Deltaproteobacteria bacterium]
MIVDIGYFSLLCALVLAAYTVITLYAGIRRNSHNLVLSARYSSMVILILVAAAYFSLTFAFIRDDFSIRFVALHSSTDLPLFYKVTAVWGGMEGSLLLWELILAFFIAIIAFRYRKTNREILPHTLIVLNLISLFLLFLLIGWSNPLAGEFPVSSEGNGLNPLLQNPGMVFHPPSLYLGYVAFSIPFAFAMGSLMRGKLGNQWIVSTRRWTLFAWFFLTIGIILGGGWAYVELGWGGYWAWDPVENGSLMPWLTGTAFLHSVIVQEKRNSLRIWNMVLIIATFTLSILGTFITRSGILNSVHSFAKSNIGPAFLIFIVAILVFSVGLLFYRQSLLVSKSQTAGIFCKENSFLLNNIVFVVMCFTVLYGTVFPLLAEGLADKKLSIQAPFFNTIMAPIAVLMVFLMGITHVLGWKKTSLVLLRKNVLVPSLLTIVVMAVIFYLFSPPWQMELLGGVSIFAGYLVVRELIRSRRTGDLPAEHERESIGSRLLKSLTKDGRRKGGLIIHLGIVIMMIGICGSFFNRETTFTFGPGEENSFGRYVMKFKETTETQSRNSRNVGLAVEILQDGKSVGVLTPVKSYYPTSQQPMTEVAIQHSLIEDLYISLASINSDGTATLNVYINPLVSFIWGSVIFFIIGFIYSMSYKPIQLRQK